MIWYIFCDQHTMLIFGDGIVAAEVVIRVEEEDREATEEEVAGEERYKEGNPEAEDTHEEEKEEGWEWLGAEEGTSGGEDVQDKDEEEHEPKSRSRWGQKLRRTWAEGRGGGEQIEPGLESSSRRGAGEGGRGRGGDGGRA